MSSGGGGGGGGDGGVATWVQVRRQGKGVVEVVYGGQ